MINKVIQSKVNLDGTYKSAILGTVTALSEFTTTIQLISPIQLQSAVMVNFLVYDARNENISLFMEPTNKKGADVSNDVDVANWNVWEVDIDSVVLSKISKYRAGRIGVSYTFYERTTSNIALDYKGLFDSYDTIPVGTYTQGDYFVCNAYNVLYNGLLFNYQDNAVYHNGKWVKDRNIKLILTTTTTDLSVDPSLLANVPDVVEQDILDIIASWGQAFVDAVALEPRVDDLEAEVIRLDNEVIQNEQDIDDMVNGDKKFNVVGYNVAYSGTLEIGETAWNDTFKCLETRVSDNVVIQHGQEQLQYVRASTNILNGQAVYVSGSTGQRLTVGVANNNIKAQAQSTIAVATENFTLVGADQFGFICNYGLVNGIKTDYATWVTGQPLYLGTNGALTNVIPSGTAYIVRVGIVGRVHGVDGSIMVAPMYMPTMGELSQVDDVTPQTDDIFIRNASGVMVNSQRFKTTETKVVSLENANMFKDVNYNNVNGVLTFTKYDDTTKQIDLPLELIVTSGYYDEVANQLVLVLANGSEIRIPVGNLLTDLDAHNVRFSGSGTNYLVNKSDVESAVKELDTQVALRVKTSDIVDNLNSTDTTKPLSAKQGKVLNDTKADKTYVDAQDQLLDDRIDNIIVGTIEGASAQEIIDARQGEVSLGANITKVKSHLAQNDNEIRTKTYTSATRPARVPTVTIMFDDGLEEDYTVLKPIADALGIPISIAYITGEDNGANKSGLTTEQALELQANGWEIMSHTVSSSNLPAHDDAELERQFTKSKQYLIDNGFAVDSMVYPLGLNDARVRAMTRKHYRAGYGTQQGINVVPLRTQNLYRVSLQDYDLANLKSRVDNIGNGWIVFYAHSGIGTFPPAEQQKLIDLVNYVKGKGISIKTGTKALDYFENTLEIENEGTGESFKVGADGKLYNPEINALNHVHVEPHIIKNDTPITSFKPRSVTTVSFTGGTGSGIPIDNGAGTLITYRINDDDVLNMQVFLPYSSGKSYERRWLAGNVWGAWDAYVNQTYVDYRDRLVFESMNIFTASSPLTAFVAEKVTYFTVNNANAVGFPNDTGGTCKVVRTQDTAWSYQEYRIINTWDKYIRYPLTETTWSAWKKLTAV